MAGGSLSFESGLSEFFDLFVLGEAEEVMQDFLEALCFPGRKRQNRKEDLLRKLGRIEASMCRLLPGDL
jgi:hypothetical protein